MLYSSVGRANSCVHNANANELIKNSGDMIVHEHDDEGTGVVTQTHAIAACAHYV